MSFFLFPSTAATYTHPTTGEVHTVGIEDVCYKPFGTQCALQSVLQYWGMDRALFEQEQVQCCVVNTFAIYRLSFA